MGISPCQHIDAEEDLKKRSRTCLLAVSRERLSVPIQGSGLNERKPDT